MPQVKDYHSNTITLVCTAIDHKRNTVTTITSQPANQKQQQLTYALKACAQALGVRLHELSLHTNLDGEGLKAAGLEIEVLGMKGLVFLPPMSTAETWTVETLKRVLNDIVRELSSTPPIGPLVHSLTAFVSPLTALLMLQDASKTISKSSRRHTLTGTPLTFRSIPYSASMTVFVASSWSTSRRSRLR